MAEKIYGLDVSHWNKWEGELLHWATNEAEFAICKATEGASFVDPKCTTWVQRFAEMDNIGAVGLYHFCRPDVCNVTQEFANFTTMIDTMVEAFPELDFFTVLDWEGKALNKNTGYCELLAGELYDRYNSWPLIYTNKSGLKKFIDFSGITENCGLWLANYSEGNSDPEPWSQLAMRQFTSKPFDKDEFYGSVGQLKKYCIPRKIDMPPEDGEPSGECLCHHCSSRFVCNGNCIGQFE